MAMWENNEELDSMYRALMHLDMEYAREMIPEASSDEVRLVAMHKARYELVTMPPELRHESRAWLEKFGFNRHKQQPWPPVGELPE